MSFRLRPATPADVPEIHEQTAASRLAIGSRSLHLWRSSWAGTTIPTFDSPRTSALSKLTAGSLVTATSGTGRAIPANHALSSSWGSILRIGVRGIGSSLLSWQIERGHELVLS